jgi:membrane protease subunit HflK
VIVLIIVGFYAAGGIYQVGPSEVGLVKTFGQYDGTPVQPGLSYHLPAPFQSVVLVPVNQVQEVEIGFQNISPTNQPTVESEALMLTGKREIIEADPANGIEASERITVGNALVIVECVIQFQINDAAAYTFNIVDPKGLVKMAAQAILREEVAQKTLDQVITTDRAQIATQVHDKLQVLLDGYEAGISIVTVKLQDTVPPPEVVPAFNDVNSARQDRETAFEDANRYRNQVVPEAEGDAQQIINSAQGYREQKIAEAQGDVALFNNVLREFNGGNPSVTLTRLYIETMEDILPNLNVLILPDSLGGNGVLQLLDLTTLLKDQGEGNTP